MDQVLEFACRSECDIEESSELGIAISVSRKLRMLRAHGLIRKVPKSHRYQVTNTGRTVIAAIIAAREANVDQLSKLAA